MIRFPDTRLCDRLIATIALSLSALATSVLGPSLAAAQTASGSSSSNGTATDSDGLVSDSTTDEQCPKNRPPENSSDAKQLTLLGVSCFKDQQFAQAYTYYHRAYQIQQSDQLRAAMGRSLHELGIYELASFYYEDFLEGKSSDDPSVSKIRNRLNQLRDDIDSKGVSAKLRSLPPDARVQVQLSNGDWVELGQTPTVVQLREDRYRFAFERNDYRRRQTRERLSRGTNPAVIEVEMYHTSSIFEVSSQKWKRAGFITGLSSLPFFGTGMVLFGFTKDKFEEAADLAPNTPRDELQDEPKRLVQEGHQLQRMAIGFTAVGGLAALTGGLLYLRGVVLQPRGDKSATLGDKALEVQWVISPNSIGVRGQF